MPELQLTNSQFLTLSEADRGHRDGGSGRHRM